MGLDPQIAGGFANAIAIFGDQGKGFSLEFITRVMPFSLNHNSLAEQISSANPIANTIPHRLILEVPSRVFRLTPAQV
jgi:hypothetical protein